jgi:hypothetical protein
VKTVGTIGKRKAKSFPLATLKVQQVGRLVSKMSMRRKRRISKMMSLYEMIDRLFELLDGLANSGAMLSEEEAELDKLEAVWYNYYEKNLKGDE